jgi:hypothetical protein
MNFDFPSCNPPSNPRTVEGRCVATIQHFPKVALGERRLRWEPHESNDQDERFHEY